LLNRCCEEIMAGVPCSGIITDDLVMPDDWNDLELIYRGLCRKDKQSKRRRIGTRIRLFYLAFLLFLSSIDFGC
jgi:hypothetical protein